MGVLVYILGRSGTGKSFSMRNFEKGDLAVINVQGKILPFKGSGKFEIINTDDSSRIVRSIEDLSKKYKTIVVDDFQYVMANEFMRRATERGYDKFTEIARHAWDIADCVRSLPNDVIVYVMCHTDSDQDGFEKLKTIGKLLDEKIVLEGMSTIVLKTAVSDGQYMFLTQNNGKDTVKSPEGMFPAYAIDNDLNYVDQKIRSYYELGDFIPESEMKKADEEVVHEEVKKDEPKKRGRSRAKKEEESTETPEEEKIEETETTESESVNVSDESGSSKSRSTSTRRSRRAEASKEIADAGIEEAGDAEDVAFKDVEMPQRKRRTKAAEEPAEEAPAEESATEEPTTRRRRRRA